MKCFACKKKIADQTTMTVRIVHNCKLAYCKPCKDASDAYALRSRARAWA